MTHFKIPYRLATFKNSMQFNDKTDHKHTTMIFTHHSLHFIETKNMMTKCLKILWYTKDTIRFKINPMKFKNKFELVKYA